MREALLAPVGANDVAGDVGAAVAAYVAARDSRAGELGVVIDERLGDQVRGALVRAGVIEESEGSPAS